MVVLLPRKVEGLAELEKLLSAARLNEWLGKVKGYYHVNSTMPKKSENECQALPAA